MIRIHTRTGVNAWENQLPKYVHINFIPDGFKIQSKIGHFEIAIKIRIIQQTKVHNKAREKQNNI